MHRPSRLAIAVLGTLTLAVAAPVAANAATNVTFETGFKPDVEFSPFYVAQDLGFYKQAGLNVSIKYDKLPNLPQSVAHGDVTFASSTGDGALIGRAKGADIKYVAQQYQAYAVGAMWLANGGPSIKTPADLKGKTIGISAPGSSTDFGLTVLLNAAHLTRKDVKVISVGFNETEALVNKQIDVAMTYTDNEPVNAAAIGHPVHVMRVANYANLTPTGIITSTSLVKKDPKEVQAFVTATMRGLKYTLQNPNAAFKIAMKRQPEVVDSKQIAIQRKILTARLKYQQAPKGHPLGWSDPTGWTRTNNVLGQVKAYGTSKKPAVGNLFTNTFTTKANVTLK